MDCTRKYAKGGLFLEDLEIKPDDHLLMDLNL
jgi:hypothetical protein